MGHEYYTSINFYRCVNLLDFFGHTSRTKGSLVREYFVPISDMLNSINRRHSVINKLWQSLTLHADTICWLVDHRVCKRKLVK
jgi:hypothetical protein